MPAYYAMPDVFVFPPANEGWAQAFSEVMAYNLPALATREDGAAADLVRDGETGLSYGSGDICARA